MAKMICSRRTFLKGSAIATAGLLGGAPAIYAQNRKRLHLSTNAYSWYVFYKRDNRDFYASLDQGLKDVVASEIDGFEPGVGGTAEIQKFIPLLQQHGLEMRSLYVNSTLHEPAEAEKSIAEVLAVAKAASQAIGTRIIVTNPNPIKWGGPEDKSDQQLRNQAQAMERLGKELASLKMMLAFHNHDIEMRQAAREFHHMAGTDPRYVHLCLDAHWVYRGSGNSSVALFDVVELYGNRVKEIHLRQSHNGVWSETLGPGDIDYEALGQALARKKVKPHLVLEVAVETGTPKTMDPVTAHRQSAEYARRIFSDLA